MGEFGIKSVMDSRNAVRIVRNTLNLVDKRLVDHGERVAFILDQMLCESTRYSEEEKLKICILGIFHDIGAYKTDEINKMVQFETQDVLEHSIYGYLFLKYFSPFGEMAEAVLYHHFSFSHYREGETDYQEIALLLSLADRIDIYLQHKGAPFDISLLERDKGKFDPRQISRFRHAEGERQIMRRLLDGSYQLRIDDIEESLEFTEEEINQYLYMLVYSIDFRSAYTVTHTMNTVTISIAVAKRLGYDTQGLTKIFYGALLHDLGKIAIPLEILEYPGKLSYQAMAVMKTHVAITDRIIRGKVQDDICEIAVRHHEKLDGSGYPQGLCGRELTQSQRIVAVADIVSALSGKRSYKDAWPEQRITGALAQMSREGLLCPDVCALVLAHYNEIMAEASELCDRVLQTYSDLMIEYNTLIAKFQERECADARPAGSAGFCHKV